MGSILYFNNYNIYLGFTRMQLIKEKFIERSTEYLIVGYILKDIIETALDIAINNYYDNLTISYVSQELSHNLLKVVCNFLIDKSKNNHIKYPTECYQRLDKYSANPDIFAAQVIPTQFQLKLYSAIQSDKIVMNTSIPNQNTKYNINNCFLFFPELREEIVSNRKNVIFGNKNKISKKKETQEMSLDNYNINSEIFNTKNKMNTPTSAIKKTNKEPIINIFKNSLGNNEHIITEVNNDKRKSKASKTRSAIDSRNSSALLSMKNKNLLSKSLSKHEINNKLHPIDKNTNFETNVDKKEEILLKLTQDVNKLKSCNFSVFGKSNYIDDASVLKNSIGQNPNSNNNDIIIISESDSKIFHVKKDFLKFGTNLKIDMKINEKTVQNFKETENNSKNKFEGKKKKVLPINDPKSNKIENLEVSKNIDSNNTSTMNHNALTAGKLTLNSGVIHYSNKSVPEYKNNLGTEATTNKIKFNDYKFKNQINPIKNNQ